jgi:hypothetical protein
MIYLVRFEVFMAATVNNAVFWAVIRVALVKTNVPEERIASTIKGKRINEVVTVVSYCQLCS